MPSQLWRGPGHGAPGLHQPGLVFLKRAACGARGGPEQEEVSAGPLCACQVLSGKNPHRPASGACGGVTTACAVLGVVLAPPEVGT